MGCGMNDSVMTILQQVRDNTAGLINRGMGERVNAYNSAIHDVLNLVDYMINQHQDEVRYSPMCSSYEESDQNNDGC